MTEKLEQQTMNPHDLPQLHTTIPLMVDLPFREKPEVKVPAEPGQTLLTTPSPSNKNKSASPRTSTVMASMIGQSLPRRHHALFIVSDRVHGSIPRGKRAREDDDAENSIQNVQKRPRTSQDRTPLAERDGNARASNDDGTGEPNPRLVGKVVEAVNDANQMELQKTIELGDTLLKRTLLHKGRNGNIWKYVKTDTNGTERVYVAKEFDGISTRSYRTETLAHRIIRDYSHLYLEVPQLMNYSNNDLMVFFEYIQGRPYRQCRGLSRHLRSRVAKAVKRIALIMLSVGVAHLNIETDNVMIRDGIETCPEDKLHHHVILTGFSRTVFKQYCSKERWRAAKEQVLQRIANF